MKTIIIPENIKLTAKVGEEVKEIDFSFCEYMINNPLSSNMFGINIEMLERTQNLIDALKVAKPHDTVEIDDDMYVLIYNFIDKPSQPYDPRIALQLLPFFRSISGAV